MDKVKQKVPEAVTPKGKIELYSPAYFAACTLGGIIGTKELRAQSTFDRISNKAPLDSLWSNTHFGNTP